MMDLYNTAILVRFIVPIIAGVGFLYLLLTSRFKVRFDFISIFIFLMVSYAAIVGLAYGNSLYYICSSAGSILCAWVVYLVCLSDSDYLYNFSNILKKFLPIYLFVGAAVIIIDYTAALFFHLPMYLSFGSISLLFPFALFLITDKKKSLLITLFFIFIGAKIGAYLGVISIFLVHFCYKHKLKISSLFVLLFFLLFVFNSILYLVRDFVPDRSSVVGMVLSKVQKYNYYHYSTIDDGNLNGYGSGRLSEIKYSLDKFNSIAGVPYITGAGLGLVYHQYYNGVWMKDVHNVHFSPVNMLEKFGIVLAAIFYWCYFTTLSRAYALLRRSPIGSRQDLQFALYIALGCLVFSMTAYALFNVLLQWFCLGYINSVYYKHDKATIVNNHPSFYSQNVNKEN